MSDQRDVLGHAWWLASRSAGVVAWLLLSLVVVMGLVMATGLAPVRVRGALRRSHERVALLALGTTAAHGALLLGDSYLRPGLSGVLVPFASGYRPVWTGVGVLAAYLAAALSLTYYARRRLGARRWRTAHRLIPVAWAMAAVHVIGAGSDAGSLWLQVPLALSLALVIALLGQRIAMSAGGRRVERPQLPAPAPAVSPAPAPLWLHGDPERRHA
ncbi:MAG TPA: ferric reductase-like transmembrane domain-containing protein [Solirubrobacteraceae bacterium]|nr:ferric reductase-like transmembrane domain-containing protein [Solirubrobacteraceae bacterium]